MRIDARLVAGAALAAAAALLWPLLGPGGPWIDFIVAGIAFGVLLGALRWSAARQSIDQDLAPGARHTTRTVAHWDPELLASHEAVRAFLDGADGSVLAQRVPGGEVRDRLGPLLDTPAPRPVLMLHPAWSYAGLALAAAVFALSSGAAFAQRLDVPVRVVAAFGLIAFGGIVYARFLNRYGGPWWVATAWGLGGLGVSLVGLSWMPGAWTYLFTDVLHITAPVLAVLAGATLLAHPHSRRTGPRFVARDADPAPLRRQELRGILSSAVVGAVFMATLLALLAVQAISGGFRTFLELAFGVVPGATIAIIIPRLGRIAGLAVEGPAAMRRLQRRRDGRSRRIIELLSDVPP